MSIINDSHAIGVDTRNLVLKTRGTLHVKVGDRFYEIDFRNLGAKEDEEKEKEDYIIFINSKNDIEGIEYPGENKLIVGLDGSLFVSKDNVLIDITPKSVTTVAETPSIVNNSGISNIKSALVSDRLYSDTGYTFDFANGDLNVRTISVEDEISIPDDTVKNKCCRTYLETLDNGTERVAKKYLGYDFIEIVEVPEILAVKSGVIVKSTVSASITVHVSDLSYDNFKFEKDGLYIIYEQRGEIIITKLN